MFANDSLFAVTHAGDAASGHALLILIPGQDAAAMILINSAEGESLKNDFSNHFIHRFGLSIPDIIPSNVIQEVRSEIVPIHLPVEILQNHMGNYSQGFSYLTVTAEDDHLVIDRDHRNFVLKALSENEFVPCEKTGEDVLMLTLIAYEGEFSFPLSVISGEYAVTSGLGSGFGFTMMFTEDENYFILDFGGITFRKSKGNT